MITLIVLATAVTIAVGLFAAKLARNTPRHENRFAYSEPWIDIGTGSSDCDTGTSGDSGCGDGGGGGGDAGCGDGGGGGGGGD